MNGSPTAARPADLAIINLAGVCTGDLSAPLLNVDTISIRDGKVAALGTGISPGDDQPVIDARGCTAAPGLIDSHVHTVMGDWTPRQNTIGFLESYAHGGITRALSASEVHLPGRPRDPAGVKALALTAHRCFTNLRPGGMTVHGGSLILEPGLVEEDFAELAREGVWQAKAGMGNFRPSRDVAPLVRWAQRHAFKVMCHTGGESIPDSSPVTAADLLEIRPDVAGHVNGGTTSLPDGDLPSVVDSGIALQLCQAGNLRSALRILDLARQGDALDRVLVASDTPTGTGMMPLAVIKSLTELTSLGDLAAEAAFCLATGNVMRTYGLDAGVLRIGAPADLILVDAPLSSAAPDALGAMRRGDLPSIAAVVTDGILRILRSRNTPPPQHMPVVLVHAAPTAPAP
ncbi:MAG: amidohydrolase [Solirubrobacteraceae bacterium]